MQGIPGTNIWEKLCRSWENSQSYTSHSGGLVTVQYREGRFLKCQLEAGQGKVLSLKDLDDAIVVENTSTWGLSYTSCF